MKQLRNLARGIDAISEYTGRSVFWLLLVMVLIGSFNAVFRYLGRFLGVDLSSNAFLELQWYLFSILFLVGGSYTLKHNAHVRVDVFYERMPPRVRQWINVIGHLGFLIPFSILMICVSWGSVWNSFRDLEDSPDAYGLPRFLIKPFVPLAFALVALQGLAEVVKAILALRGEAVEEEEREDTPI